MTESIRRPPSDTATPPFTQNQLRGIARSMVSLILAQVLYAISGIHVFGVEPFAGLKDWADTLVATANDAYYNASVAQGAADYANSSITGLLTTDVSGGQSLFSSFEGTAATNIGASFTQEYDGTGSGTFGLDGAGNTKWNKSGGFTRRCFARHNTALTTDYQRGRVVITTRPQNAISGTAPAIYVCLRMNAACDTLVYARLENDFAAIGCLVGGSETVLHSGSVTINNGDVIDFYAGTDNDDREFILKRNGVNLLSPFTDASAVSSYGSSYLYAGLGNLAPSWAFFTSQGDPGKVAAWAAVDRQATTY